MRLAKLMKTTVFSVGPYDSLDKAICLMDEHYIHHLPVIENGNIVGMLSDRDLLISVGWKLECERRPHPNANVVGPLQIGDIMSRPVLCLGSDNEVHTAAHMMAVGKFHAMPIRAGHRLLGLVTSTDILRAFCQQQDCAAAPPLLRDLVRKHMRTHLRTVGLDESLHNAARIMREANVRHLPVTAKAAIIGIVSDRDVRQACGTEMIEDEKAQSRGEFYIGPTTVMDIMSKQVRTISETTPIIDAIERMIEHQIGCLPVTRQSNYLVGLLTDTDLLRLIAQADDGE